MYRSSQDVAAAVMLSQWSGTTCDDQDVDGAVAATGSFARALRSLPARAIIHINIVDPEYPPPLPAQRRKLATQAGAFSDHRALYHFIFVSTSPIARGAMKAVSWLQPQSRTYRCVTAKSADEAIAWIEKHLPDAAGAARTLVEGSQKKVA